MLAVVVALVMMSAGDASARIEVSANVVPARASTVVDVTLRAVGPGRAAVGRSDFQLSAAGDMFAVRSWDARRSRVTIPPRHARRFHLTFEAPRAAANHAVLFYRSEVIALARSRALRHAPNARAAQQPPVNTFATGGVGQPWDTAADSAGNIWFAEPGCDFAPTCPASTAPGQIGELDPSSGAVSLYTLPDIPGNQPIFVEFDSAGNLWFTTPNNNMIGEFSPSTGRFVGQWPVTSGSGPWDLTFANGQIWFTQHYASAVGRFDPATHAFQDFPTPSGNSNPYGIAASGGRIWFTENNSSVDRVAVLDMTRGNAISEYPIVQPLSGTPHLIAVDPNGQPWWTEGWSNTIATLNPAVATPGNCGAATGACNGVSRVPLPPSTTCGADSHVSGIAFDAAANKVWLDNSLTTQVGSFTPSTQTFDMNTLSSCDAHPHDGLTLDGAGNVWFDEEFANAIGQLISPRNSAPSSPAPGSGTPVAAQTADGLGVAPANTAAPRIRGSRREGRTLSVQDGSWANGPTDFSYRWQRCAQRCMNIARATRRSYKLRARDIDAKVRVVVSASNAAGSAQAASHRAGPIGPSLKRVHAALSRLLSVSMRGSTITRLRRTGGYAGAFTAPSAGRLRVYWYARHVRVATSQRRFGNAHKAKLTIHVTGAGKQLLRRVHKLTIGAKAIFTPVDQAGVVGRRRVKLSAL